MEKCDGCSREIDDVTVLLKRMVAPVSGALRRYCSGCCSGSTSASPDVYYGYGSGTHTEENIAYPNGTEKAGQPIPFSSKREKAMAMKIAGVHEAGDRVKGMRRDDMVPANRKKYFM